MKKALMVTFIIMVYVAMTFMIIGFVIDNDWPIYAFLVNDLCIIVYAIILVSMNIGEMKSPSARYYKYIMIMKLLLVPYFIFTFIVAICLAIGALMPWLTLILGAAILILIGFNYVLVLALSLPFVFHNVGMVKNGKINPIIALITSAVSFAFVGDVISSVLMYVNYGEIENFIDV